MGDETTRLRIKSERLGTVQQVIQLLEDFEAAYNSIYAFDFIVDSLVSDRERRFQLSDEQFGNWRKYWKEFSQRKEVFYDPFLFEIFMNSYLNRILIPSTNLLDIQSKIDVNKIMLPSDRLIISKVNIQSMGFWEFLGSLNPLQQIREYLKDRHERLKDKKYRSRQEEELGDLSILEKRDSIINKRIQMLKDLGFSENEIRQHVMSMVVEPLNKLGKHQDNGQIDGVEE